MACSPEIAEAACASAGAEVLLLGDPHYPRCLVADTEAPAVLFMVGAARGSSDLEHRRRVAVVGTRAPTRAGVRTATELGLELASAGVAVVSGLARGIDAAAHRGALDAPCAAPLIGVLGCAVDASLPPDAEELRSAVARRGVLLSEVPPGAAGKRWMFAVRNRLMAASAELVVVVESHAAGGSLHTVRAAQRRGLPVAVVPGSVHSQASAGTNALLVAGQAWAVRHAEDVLALLDKVDGDDTAALRPPADTPARRTWPTARPQLVTSTRSREVLPGGERAGRPGPQQLAGKKEPAAATTGARQPRDDRSARSSAAGPGDEVSAMGADRGSRAAGTVHGTSGAATSSGAGSGQSASTLVFEALDEQPASIDTVSGRCGLRIGEVALILEQLADAGAAEHENGWWARAITPAGQALVWDRDRRCAKARHVPGGTGPVG